MRVLSPASSKCWRCIDAVAWRKWSLKNPSVDLLQHIDKDRHYHELCEPNLHLWCKMFKLPKDTVSNRVSSQQKLHLKNIMCVNSFGIFLSARSVEYFEIIIISGFVLRLLGWMEFSEQKFEFLLLFQKCSCEKNRNPIVTNSSTAWLFYALEEHSKMQFIWAWSFGEQHITKLIVKTPLVLICALWILYSLSQW